MLPVYRRISVSDDYFLSVSEDFAGWYVDIHHHNNMFKPRESIIKKHFSQARYSTKVELLAAIDQVFIDAGFETVKSWSVLNIYRHPIYPLQFFHSSLPGDAGWKISSLDNLLFRQWEHVELQKGLKQNLFPLAFSTLKSAVQAAEECVAYYKENA